MQTHRSILLAAGLSLASCAGSPAHHSTADAAVPSPKFTVHVVEASGGAWSASSKARAAMESLEGVDRMMLSGTRATLVLAAGAELTAADVKQAIEEVGLTFESFEELEVERPAAAYVAKTPKFTWANTAKKVRAAFMEELVGVQDVFCGPETVVHMKNGSADLAPGAIEEALARFEVACDGVVRDDSAVL